MPWNGRPPAGGSIRAAARSRGTRGGRAPARARGGCGPCCGVQLPQRVRIWRTARVGRVRLNSAKRGHTRSSDSAKSGPAWRAYQAWSRASAWAGVSGAGVASTSSSACERHGGPAGFGKAQAVGLALVVVRAAGLKAAGGRGRRAVGKGLLVLENPVGFFQHLLGHPLGRSAGRRADVHAAIGPHGEADGAPRPEHEGVVQRTGSGKQGFRGGARQRRSGA